MREIEFGHREGGGGGRGEDLTVFLFVEGGH